MFHVYKIIILQNKILVLKYALLDIMVEFKLKLVKLVLVSVMNALVKKAAYPVKLVFYMQQIFHV